MKHRFRPRLSYANVIASLALFIALGGAAIAAGLPKNSVGPNQLKRGAVSAAKLKKGAVTSPKIANKAVTTGKLGPAAVTPGNIGNGAVTTAKIANGAVIAASIKNGVITTNKLNKGAVTAEKMSNNAVTTDAIANEAVNSAKLGKGSVTAAKLSSEIGPLLGNLKSGQTIGGVFDLGGTAQGVDAIAKSATSLQFPLAGTPAVSVLGKGQTNANCGGTGSGGVNPQATRGNLCVYITESSNLAENEGLIAEHNTRLGFGLKAKAKEAGEFFAYGVWAVTAP